MVSRKPSFPIPDILRNLWARELSYIPTSYGRMVFLGEREVVVPARDLTGRMLQEGLDALFGVCPWETLLTPTYRFFRLGHERERAELPAVSRARPIAAVKRPWWQFL